MFFNTNFSQLLRVAIMTTKLLQCTARDPGIVMSRAQRLQSSPGSSTTKQPWQQTAERRTHARRCQQAMAQSQSTTRTERRFWPAGPLARAPIVLLEPLPFALGDFFFLRARPPPLAAAAKRWCPYFRWPRVTGDPWAARETLSRKKKK